MRATIRNLLCLGVSFTVQGCIGDSSTIGSGGLAEGTSIRESSRVKEDSPELSLKQTVTLNKANAENSESKINLKTVDLTREVNNLPTQKSYALVDAKIQPAIGWNSSTQTFAPQSCWNYSINLQDHTSTGISMYTKSDSEILGSLGINYSLNLMKIAVFEVAKMKETVDYFTGSTRQSVRVNAEANSKAVAVFNVTGLNEQGEKIYKNSPQQFARLCGDEVLMQLPLKISQITSFQYQFESSLINEKFNMEMTGGVKGAPVEALLNINGFINSSHANAEANVRSFIEGNVDGKSLVEAQKAISSCFKADDRTGSNMAECQRGLSLINNAVEDGYRTSSSSASSGGYNGGGEDLQTSWIKNFVVDYTSDKFQSLNADDFLRKEGILKPINVGPQFKEYQKVIVDNMALLLDYRKVDQALKDIGVGIGELPDSFITAVTPYAKYNLQALYSSGVEQPMNLLDKKLRDCLYASNDDDIKKYCSALPAKPNITQDLAVYEGGTPQEQLVRPYILKTIQALMYKDRVSANISPNNPYASLIADTYSHIVYLPGKLDKKLIVTIPEGITNKIIRGSVVPKRIYLSVFQYGYSTGSDAWSWGNWDDSTISGVIGYYDGNPEVLLPYPNRSNINTLVKGANCNFFSPDSHLCEYKVTIGFDRSIYSGNIDQYSGFPGSVVEQTITDTYSSSLEPSGNKLFGSNEFSTLYPYNK